MTLHELRAHVLGTILETLYSPHVGLTREEQIADAVKTVFDAAGICAAPATPRVPIDEAGWMSGALNYPGVPKIRAGDAVFHRPCRETWAVASVTDDGRFFACGWPETRASIEDIDLVRKCSDDEHVEMLRRVAQTRSDDGYSSRASWALENMRVEGISPVEAGTA